MSGLRRSVWLDPYRNTLKGQTALRLLTNNKTGCYLIRKKGKTGIAYVGFSGYNLYKTMYRHFQKWQDNSQYRAVFPKTGYEVRVILCPAEKAEKLEQALIVKYRPTKNYGKWQGIASFTEIKSMKGAEAFRDAEEFYINQAEKFKRTIGNLAKWIAYEETAGMKDPELILLAEEAALQKALLKAFNKAGIDPSKVSTPEDLAVAFRKAL